MAQIGKETIERAPISQLSVEEVPGELEALEGVIGRFD